MDEKVSILFLRLEGPLQSWGEHSKWDYRDTAMCPTKSGIVGLIGCAMGIKRNSEELYSISDSIKIAIRIDKPGIVLADFHTVRPTLPEGIIITSQGKPRGDSNTIVSRRQYLQDANFLVAVQGEKELLYKIREAMENPKWVIFLGRKSCVPSVPIYQGIQDNYNSLEDAICHFQLPNISKDSKEILYEIDSFDDEGYIRSDCISNDEKRSFLNRRVKLKTITVDEVEKNVHE